MWGAAVGGFGFCYAKSVGDRKGRPYAPKKKTAAFAAVFSQQNGKKQMAPGHMRLQSMHRHRLVQGFILRSKPWKFPA